MKVALFATCVVDTMVPQVAMATARLLERLGHEVVVPPDQSCCGQMHVNTGYRREAVPIVANHVKAFAGAEAVVAPSGSCVASIHHQQAAVARRFGEDALADEAEHLAGRTYELSQFLVDVLGVTDVGAYYPHRVTYHPTCHSLRMLHVGDRPLRLLRAVRGLTLIELPAAEQCCGFGGTFAVKNADTSTAMLTDKMANVLSTHAEVCTAGDASCLMHIGGGLSRLRSGTRTVHLAEILASTEEAVSPQQSTKPSLPHPTAPAVPA
jgi:L-lactate dehydrogenase complex protein LldE